MSKNVLNEKVPQAKKSLPIWAIVLIFIVGIAIGFGAFWMIWTARMSKVTQNQNLPTPVANSNQPPTDVSLPSATTEVTSTTATKENFILRDNARSIDLDVKWSKPRQLSYDEAVQLFTTEPTPYTRDMVESALDRYLGSDNSNEESNFASMSLIWHMGVVQSGPDKGSDIYLLQEVDEGLGYWYTYTYLMQSAEVPSAIYAIGGSKSQFKDFQGETGLVWPIRAYAIQMPNAKISSLKFADEIVLQNGKKLQKNENRGSELGYRFIIEQDPEVTFTKVATTSDGKNIFEKVTKYSDRDIHEGCLYLFGPDGSAVKYSPSIPTTTKKDSSWGEVTIPSIIWNDGTPNEEAYETRSTGGCGYYDCLDIRNSSDVGPKNELKIVGKTIDGDIIYAPISINNALIKGAYDQWYVPDGKSDIESFLKKYPNAILLWQDPIGRWVRLQMKSLMPLAECGKPVIYLYPTKTTPVSVSLPRFINVTVSDPAYPTRGWNVVAHPDGNLDYADGKTYGSLYWEGTGVGYVSPREGFVVKDGEQKVFLTETLAKYGLNAKESQEFIDFWLPQMTGAPYYRISFLTDDWSKAAPLNVTPKPDTNIRIFMDWQKLSAPISIAQPKIVTPVRNGFTLVEWGGLLYKN